MISKDHIPGETLRKDVRLIRIRHFLVNDPSRFASKPFPPRPEQCLIFYPRGFEVIEDVQSGKRTTRSGVVLSGQFTRRINRYVGSSEFLMIEVDLQPGALHRLTGLPFSALRDTDMDAEVLFPGQAREVVEKLANASCYAGMINILETFLDGLFSKTSKTYTAVDAVMENMANGSGSSAVDDYTRMAYLSGRQLERKFKDAIGVGPKTFLRLCRFNKAYWMRLNHPEMDWMSIIVACGYTDYQHMVKDFKEFASATPAQFLAEEKLAPGRVLGLTR